jgi:hypothetical protein
MTYTQAKDKILLYLIQRKLGKARKEQSIMLDKVLKLWR